MDSLLTKLHEETRRPLFIPADRRTWPDAWKTQQFKEYPRLPYTVLPEPEPLSVPLDIVLQRRSSKRDFDPEAALSLQQISNLLSWSAGMQKNRVINGHPARVYPSGGGLYAGELYLSLRKGEGVEAGVYHYDVKRHALERLLGADGDADIRAIPNYPWAKNAPVILLMSAVFGRTMAKYRGRGYRFALLEIGALLENIYLVSEALGIGCCALGSVIDDRAETILDLRGDESLILHCAVGTIRA